MKYSYRKFVLICITGISSLLMANAGYALDEKVYPGNMCQTGSGSQDGDISHWATYLSNGSGFSRGVACPIVRDNMTNVNGIPTVYVRVNRSASASTNFTCYLYNMTSTGSSWFVDSASFSGTGNTSLYLSLPTTTGFGHHTIYCSVPNGSRIISYRVEEI